jgi:hypothetical protein
MAPCPSAATSTVFDTPPEAIGEPIYVTDDITDPKRRLRPLCAARPHDRGEQKPALRADPLPARSVRWSPSFRAATITALQASLAQSHRRGQQAQRGDLHEKAYGPPSAELSRRRVGAAIKADAFSTPPRKPNWDNNPLTRAWKGDGVGSRLREIASGSVL